MGVSINRLFLLAMDIKGKLPSMAEKTVRYRYGLEKYRQPY